MPRTNEHRTETLFANVTESEKKSLDRLRRLRGLSTQSDMVRALVREAADDRMTAGEWIHGLATAAFAPQSEREASVNAFLTRAVAGVTTTSDAGLVPIEVIGDLINFVDASRPVVSSSNQLPMPEKGKTFTRGRATQRTLSGAQATELTEVTNRQLLVADDTVTKHTHGTTIAISEQDMEWMSPASLEGVIKDAADSYALSTETEAALAIEAAVIHPTNDGTLALTATAAQFHAALQAALLACYTASQRWPDRLYVAPDRAAYILGLLGTGGLPFYPDGQPMGLPLIVSPGFRAGFTAVGVSHLVEVYEILKGFVRTVLPQIPTGVVGAAGPAFPFDPSSLQFAIPFRGYLATLVQPKGIFAMSELGADLTWDGDLI